MKISNPLKPLIILVCLNLLLIAAIGIGAKAQVPQPDERMHLLILCAFCFIGTTALSLAVAKIFIDSFVKPIESSASSMMAALDRENNNAELLKSNLPALTEKLIRELEASRQRERLIADYSPEILCCLDEQRRVLDLNVQTETVLEYPIISLLATPLDAIVYNDDKEEFLAYFEACKTGKQNKLLESRVSSRSGNPIDLEWQVEWSPSSRCYYCLAKNISDRKENQRLKAEIAAMVNHDLRAPVSSLSYLLQNLQEGTFGELPAEANKRIEKANDNVAQMLRLINQLLDAEKLEGGHLEIELKIIPLCELYDSCRNLLHDLAEGRGIKLHFPEDSTLMIMADFDRSVQILCNLLSNAIKWSQPSSEVRVEESADNKTVTISVVDHGPGIPPEKQQSIFQRFHSFDKRSDKSLASTGLGLYIAKRLTELQGGAIGVKSKTGEGSTFWFTAKQAHERDLPGFLPE